MSLHSPATAVLAQAAGSGFDPTKLQSVMLAIVGCGLIYMAGRVAFSKKSGDLKESGSSLGTAIVVVIIAGLGASTIAYGIVGPAFLRGLGINV